MKKYYSVLTKSNSIINVCWNEVSEIIVFFDENQNVLDIDAGNNDIITCINLLDPKQVIKVYRPFYENGCYKELCERYENDELYGDEEMLWEKV